MERLSVAPGKADQPYILEAYGGENIYVPTSAGTTRHYVTSLESKGEFLICGGGGVAGALPVPFHYHQQERHDFLCIKGQMKVWLNDQCRVLNEGDYASVTPKAIHSYQFLSNHTETFGIVVPGGWEKFFRFIGEVYDGPMWPDVDIQDPFQTIVPRVKAASEKFDVIPVRNYVAVEAQPWDNKIDGQLPGVGKPYFLRNSKGPSAVLGGTVVRPIATGAETNNNFTLGSIESSSHYPSQVLHGGICFPYISHCLQVTDGYIRITIDQSEPTRVGPFETVWIPEGFRFEIIPVSRYTKFYIYSKPGGLIDLLYEAGKEMPHVGPNCMIPESPQSYDKERLGEYKGIFDFDL